MEKTLKGVGKSSFDLLNPQTFLEALDLRGGEAAADLGCGAGNYAIALAQRLPAGRVVGIDLWEGGVDRLLQRARDLNLPHVQGWVADISENLPLRDGEVDLILMATVLHDLVEDGTASQTLAEVRRVLGPQGRLAVVEFRRGAGPPGPPDRVRITPQGVDELLAAQGFRPGGEALTLSDNLYLVQGKAPAPVNSG